MKALNTLASQSTQLHLLGVVVIVHVVVVVVVAAAGTEITKLKKKMLGSPFLVNK